MEYQTIREARLRRPFRPFVLRATNNRSFIVREPTHLAVASFAVAVVDSDDIGVCLAPDEVESLIFFADPDKPEVAGEGSSLDYVSFDGLNRAAKYERLREIRSQRPFRRFMLRLSTGKQIAVRGPDQISITPTMLMAGDESESSLSISPQDVSSILYLD